MINEADQELRIANSIPVPTYQLSGDGVDIPLMVNRAQAELPSRRRQAVYTASHSGIWNGGYPSLRSFNFRVQYKGYALGGEHIYVLDPKTGAVNVPSDQLNNKPLGEFFNTSRIWNKGQFTQLRGLTYYVASDPNKNTTAKKLEVITEDVRDGLVLIDSIDRRSLGPMDYLLLLGIFDNIKSQFLTTFHALTFRERGGFFPDDNEYTTIRKEAQRSMVTVTRGYQQAILGQPFDEALKPANIKEALTRIVDYIANSDHPIDHFTYREVSNPVIIMLGANEAARKKSLPDLIIGIPSGGTEVAVATHLMFEYLYPNSEIPDLAFVPLSFHYRRHRPMDHNKLVEILRQLTAVSGSRVLIVDDNSNTGLTLQTMAKAVSEAGANSISAHIAELDPGRIIAKYKKRNGSAFPVVNLGHPDLQTAMGIGWTSDEDGSDFRRKELGIFIKEANCKIESGIS